MPPLARESTRSELASPLGRDTEDMILSNMRSPIKQESRSRPAARHNALLIVAVLASLCAPATAGCRDAEIAKIDDGLAWVQAQASMAPAQVELITADLAAEYASCARTDPDRTERAKLFIKSAQARAFGGDAFALRGLPAEARRIFTAARALLETVVADRGVDPYIRSEAVRVSGILRAQIANPPGAAAPLPSP